MVLTSSDLVARDIRESGPVMRNEQVSVTAFRTPHPPITDNYAYRFETPEAIAAHFPHQVQFTRPEGGMFLWITLPPDLSAIKLFELAIQRSVCFVPGSAFHACGGGDNTLRLNFSNADEARIDTGIRRLAEAIHRLTAKASDGVGA